jgi:hypothetical protein
MSGVLENARKNGSPYVLSCRTVASLPRRPYIPTSQFQRIWKSSTIELIASRGTLTDVLSPLSQRTGNSTVR